MPLTHLRIDGVRCLQDVALDLSERRNYLWGSNGAGKTSCLEAIYLLGRGRSFRARQTTRLIRHGMESFNVFGLVSRGADAEHRLGIEFSAGSMESRCDGATVQSQADMLRLLPVHVLDPRLHQLVEAGPSERRRYIDAGVFHVEHRFLNDWRQYRRILGQRNAALKSGQRGGALSIWTEPLISTGTAVHQARRAYVEALSDIASRLAGDLLGHNIRLQYRPGWRKDLEFAEALEESRERDQGSGFTQIGPHRADLSLDFDAGGVRDTASRGQQKLVAAALVIAQVELFEQRTDLASTVLVDDASAELDRESQERLLGALCTLKSQLILTGLEKDAMRPEPGYPVFHVEQGKVQPVLY